MQLAEFAIIVNVVGIWIMFFKEEIKEFIFRNL